jgi:hypothetical protein
MSGDVHVRICEHLGVRFPRVTRLIITGATRALLVDEVKPLVMQFLEERGLELAEDKTRVVHINDGFDFLGFNLRKYNGTLLIKPATTSIAAVKDKVRTIIKNGGSVPPGVLIHRLNPVIRPRRSSERTHLCSQERTLELRSRMWVRRGYQWTWRSVGTDERVGELAGVGKVSRVGSWTHGVCSRWRSCGGVALRAKGARDRGPEARARRCGG